MTTINQSPAKLAVGTQLQLPGDNTEKKMGALFFGETKHWCAKDTQNGSWGSGEWCKPKSPSKSVIIFLKQGKTAIVKVKIQ